MVQPKRLCESKHVSGGLDEGLGKAFRAKVHSSFLLVVYLSDFLITLMFFSHDIASQVTLLSNYCSCKKVLLDTALNFFHFISTCT